MERKLTVAKEESEIVVRMPGNQPAWIRVLLLRVLAVEALLPLADVHASREISCSPPLNAVRNSCVIVAGRSAIRESNSPVISVVVCAGWKKHCEF